MNEYRWSNANYLIECLRTAEKAAEQVSQDHFGMKDGAVAHPTYDEAKQMQETLRGLRRLAARIAEREASE